MDVAFVSNVVYPFVTGGAQKRIHEIGRRLVDRGHDVTVYGRHFWDGPRTRAFEGMTLRAVSDARDLYAGDRRSITEAVEFAASLYQPLRRATPMHDVVVASVFPYFPVLTSAAATRSDGPALVTTWHEVWGDYWSEYLGALGPGGRLVERATARVPQHPVAVSERTADRLAELGQSRDRIEVVPNGIDIDEIDAVSGASEGFDVLYVGRLTPAKNVDLLLRAFDQVAERADATLGIVGDGPEANHLRDIVADMAHGDRVTLLGTLGEHRAVLAQMAAATVFVSPSVREGFGITALEALAADCTVVVADHPESAASDVIGDGGFAVDPTIDAVADAIARGLAGERPPREPRTVARRYDWDVIVEQAERVYADSAGY